MSVGPLLGGFHLLLLDGERLGAGPWVLGDVEQHAFGTVKFDLEPANPISGLVHVMFPAQRLDLLRIFFDVVDEDAEVVQAGIVEPFADLVGFEPEDRQVDRSVAQMITVGERPVGLTHFLEVECFLVELCHRIRVFGSNGNVTQFGHFPFPSHPSFPRKWGPEHAARRPWIRFRGNDGIKSYDPWIYSAASFTGAGSGSAPAQPCSAMSNNTRSG